MSFTPTTNYALQKIGVNTEVDAWGDDVNSNMDIIDARMKINADAAAAASTLAGTKAPLLHSHAQADVTGLVADLALKAPLASPFLTGTPQAPTPSPGTNTTQLATTAFVGAAITASAPGGTYAPINSPAFTGTPTTPRLFTPLNTTSLRIPTMADVADSILKVYAGALITSNLTLAPGSAGNMLVFGGSSALNCIVNTAAVFEPYMRFDFIQYGTGQVSFTGTATCRSRNGTKLAGQYAGATIWFISASEYVLFGDTTT